MKVSVQPLPIDAGSARPAILAVYAPFGSDRTLSDFPEGRTRELLDHPLVHHLQAVAGKGVDVLALVDRVEAESAWIRIPANAPAEMEVSFTGKQDMGDWRSLSELLVRAGRLVEGGAVLLALEGHGAGYLPELDLGALNAAVDQRFGGIEWRLGQTHVPFKADGQRAVLEGAPVLPVGCPVTPTDQPVLSTWALGQALADAAERTGHPVAAIHFNNCFNMSVEVLHTVSPHALFATGYCNYNFFTAGQVYPAVFERLAAVGTAGLADVARWFAEENHRLLAAHGHEPTVAGTVDLARMHDIVEKVDDLADALLAALRTTGAAERPALLAKIRDAIDRAQQYDARPDLDLGGSDELTDLDSLAAELLKADFSPFRVAAAADALRGALAGIKVYGDKGSPWMDTSKGWDFSSKNLAMNIYLPDPLRQGLWDWRAQYYLDVNPDPRHPKVQKHLIDFVKVTDWVDFLIEYHRDVPFVGLRPARSVRFPVMAGRTAGRRPGDGSSAG